MVRSREPEEEDVSLFPFLSILSCVIGVLTLLITAMAISQMDTPEIVETEKLDELVRQDESLDQEIQQLEQSVAQSNKSVAELIQSRNELAVLMEQLEARDKKRQELEKRIDPNLVEVDIDAKIRELQTEKEKLTTQLSGLQQELGDRQDRKEGIVQVRPGGSGVDFNPTFVECRKEGIVLYGADGSVHNVVASQIGSDVKFLSTLDRISEAPSEVITFLLREDGVDTYYRARNVARARYARNGKLPVLGKGKLDLTLFTRKGPDAPQE